MSKTETKNEQLSNIKSLMEFETIKVNPFQTGLDKLKKDVYELSS